MKFWIALFSFWKVEPYGRTLRITLSEEFDGWGKKSENEAAEFSLAQAVFYDLHAP